MSNVCCDQFQGWIKSFTKNESILAILEAILVVVFVVSLILSVLHFIACASPAHITGTTPNITVTPSSNDRETTSARPESISTNKQVQSIASESVKYNSEVATNAAHTQPTSERVCSWTPSAKTTPVTHYYIEAQQHLPANNNDISISSYIGSNNDHTLSDTTPIDTFKTRDTGEIPSGYVEVVELTDMSDGEDAEEEYRSFVMALVKLKPHGGVIFGCILTVVSEHWTLTAASCVAAVEAAHSLESFVIMERYGTGRGPLRPIQDVRVHPLYGGRNSSYDLAALRSAASLVARGGRALPLASALDAALAAVGGAYSVLGYGPFRAAGGGAGLRRAAVHRVGARACAPGARRHVGAGRAAAAPACAGAALCCGALFARGLPCRYCAGTPLLRAARLYGVMADNPHCGVSCEPQLYVNVADLADWIGSVLRQ